MSAFSVRFVDSGREPQCAPDPAYPTGMVIDFASDAVWKCTAKIPYPSPRCGIVVIACEKCGYRQALTVAGRVDDPHTVIVPCKIAGVAGRA